MNELVSNYGLPVTAGAVILAIINYAIGKFWPSKPKVPGEPVSPDKSLLSLIPELIARLARKPPITTDAPITTPTSIQELIQQLLELINTPEAPSILPDIHTTPIEQDMSHLVACAQSVSDRYKDFDITVTISASGVNIQKVKRGA